jgi:hypothetical protein
MGCLVVECYIKMEGRDRMCGDRLPTENATAPSVTAQPTSATPLRFANFGRGSQCRVGYDFSARWLGSGTRTE